jgi:hypothetical protein
MNDVNVPLKSNKQKKGHWRKQDPEADTDMNPDPLVNTDPRIRIRTKRSRIQNIGKNEGSVSLYRISFSIFIWNEIPELSCLRSAL